jgi:hypothetical protein
MPEYMRADVAGSPAGGTDRARAGGDRRLALSVRLAEDGADAGRLERLTAALRLELLELGVEEARLAREGRAPEGTKAGSTMWLGTLLVTLAGSPVLAAMVGVIAEWVKRDGARSATLRCGEHTLTLTGLSRDEQHRVVDGWFERLGG